MDVFVNDLTTLERKTFLYFLVVSDLRQSEQFHLWRKFIKPTLLNRYLPSLENQLRNMGMIWFPRFRCKICSEILKWVENGNLLNEDDDSILHNSVTYLDCTHLECSRYCSPIMKCNIVNAMDFFTEVLSLKNSQMIISALHLLLISVYSLNSISQPSLDIIEDPFSILREIYNKNPNALKYGGGKSKSSILLIDIYECDEYPEYPILCFCDTITVPCRFYFHPLKFKSKKYNPPPKYLSSYISRKRKRLDCYYDGETKFDLHKQSLIYKYSEGICIPQYQEDFFVNELIEIGNMCVKPGSDIVLGSKIKNYLSKKNLKNINFKVDVPDSKLPFYVFKPAYDICKICLQIAFSKNDSNKNVPNEENNNHENSENNIRSADFKPCLSNCKSSYDLLSIHLISAVWLLLFANTPFETILFHIVCLGLHIIH